MVEHNPPVLPQPAAEASSSPIDASAPNARTEALHASDELLRSLFRASLDGIAVLDLQGRIVDVNDAYCHNLGYARDELLGMRIGDIETTEKGAETAARIARIVATGGDRFETRHRRKDGTVIEVEVSVSFHHGDGGRLVVFERDITLRRAALAEADERLQLAERAAGAGYWHWELGSDDVTWSPALCALHGLDPRNRKPRYADWLAVVHPDDRSALEARIAQAVNERTPLFVEYRIVLPDGGLRWITSYGQAFYDDRGRPLRMAGICVEATQAHAREAALRSAEQRWKFALEGAAQGVWDWDLPSHKVYYSPQYKAMLGYAPDDIGDGEDEWSGRLHPDDRGPTFAAVERHFRGDSPVYDIEFRMRRKDGRYAWIQSRGLIVERTADGAPKRIIGTHTDISARKAWEAERVHAAEQLRLATEGAGIGIWYWPMPGEDLDWSDRCKTLLALPPGDSPTLPKFLEAVHPDDREPLRKKIDDAIAQRGEFVAEFRMIQLDGSIHWISSLGRVYVNPDGSLRGMGGIVIDVTERKRNDEALLALTQNLEAQVAERTAQATAASAAKSEFLAHMSHEIRTPMNVVLSLTRVLEEESLTPEQSEVVRTIDQAGQSLLHIIDDILDFSKIEAGQLRIEQRPFDLATLLGRLEALLRDSAMRKGLALSIVTPAENPPVLLGDALRLKQVLVNLINNAIKFTEQGQVEVVVTVPHKSGSAARLRFEVRDTGIGIASDVVPTLFKPFTQANVGIARRFGGTGLGLAICKHLVDIMGGTIGCRSHPGSGSCFWFEVSLPWAGSHSPEGGVAPPQASAPAISLDGLRVLVVDDNQMNLFAVERLLGKQGAEVVIAPDGQQALQILGANPKAFDVVLMDVQMPVMDGLTATRAIRADPALAGLPVIALTAGVLAEERQNALAAGVDDFLPKPLDRRQMTEMLARILRARSTQG